MLGKNRAYLARLAEVVQCYSGSIALRYSAAIYTLARIGHGLRLQWL